MDADVHPARRTSRSDGTRSVSGPAALSDNQPVNAEDKTVTVEIAAGANVVRDRAARPR